ncbi:nucleoporin GLE1, partial [Lecanoromycetidae sp. Uapishka_2]
MSSPWRLARDSPSRQLLWELGQLNLSDRESFNSQLDREHEERAALHRQALNAASAEHDRVRRSAEQFRQRLDAQIQAEQQRREEENQRDLERLQKEKEEQEIVSRRREAERLKAAKAREKELADIKRQEEKQEQEEATNKRQADKDRQDVETNRSLQEERRKQSQRASETVAAEAKLKEAAAAAQNARAAPVVKSQVQLTPKLPAQTSTRNAELEAEHSRYLDIHQKLKDLRKSMASQARQNPGLKTAVGEMRREIKKCVGQLREGKGTNKSQLSSIMTVLKKAATVTDPAIDVTLYLATPPVQPPDTQFPALLVYLLNIFAKAIISQFIDEAGVKPQLADPVGTVASHIFAVEHFRWKDVSLIDILLAKFHVVCPVLFGIYGDERTVQGKQRLGWSREDTDGPFIPEQRHFERMTGLAAGYAAISLRNYEKAQAKNPYPDSNYWKALARITNVPSDQISQTHFVILKGMIQGYETKFLLFFGDAAIAALRHALIDLPKRSPPSVAVKALAGLLDVLKRDQKLTL